MIEKEIYLFCYPLSINKIITTFSGLRCFHLIWLKCCYTHNFINITVTKRDRERIGLPRISYIRGIEELEKDRVIVVDRKNGRSARISVNIEKLDQKSKDFIFKGR